MKATELREKSVDELNELLLEQQKDLFKWRMQKAGGELGQSHLMTTTKREIARIKTVLHEKAGQG